jgi:lysyl-tRNA synthetase class 2
MALGRIGDAGDEECVIATATQDGVLCAILHFVPWGTDGLSLDLMRRDRAAQPGLNDFLIVEAIKTAPDLGVKRVSLNFAFFRAALARGERIGAGPVLRAWRRILLFLSRWFQIESLYKFNAKFCPEWVPRCCGSAWQPWRRKRSWSGPRQRCTATPAGWRTASGGCISASGAPGRRAGYVD